MDKNIIFVIAILVALAVWYVMALALTAFGDGARPISNFFVFCAMVFVVYKLLFMAIGKSEK